ncbi:MAG: YafY family protein [Treponema sp.]|nr:YafY family protein [Treponema sp.]
MQTEHLFELTYIILEKKQVTASQMAEHFGVSARTIYRWLDALNLAGVPVVATKGKGGGIQLSPEFTLDKAVLTENEKQEILSSVLALQVLSGGTNSAVSKLKAITKANADWIKVDFAPWNPEQNKIKDTFSILKTAILNRKEISIEYYSAEGKIIKRKVEPWKIVFKGQAWYLYGFCKNKKAPRYFKLSRIQNLKLLKTEITKEESDYPENEQQENSNYKGDKISSFIQLKAMIKNSEIHRILDEYKVDSIEDFDEEYKTLTLTVPDMYWIKSWILSFGSSIKILEPENLRKEIKNEIIKMYKNI